MLFLQEICALLLPCLLAEHFHSFPAGRAFFDSNMTKYRHLLKKLKTLIHIKNNVTCLLTFLLEVLLRCFSTLVKLRSFLSHVLLECCLGEWSLFEAWSQVGNSVVCYLQKLNYTNSVRGLQPCFLSSRLPSF